MKKHLAWLLILLLCGCALAEGDDYWTRSADLYYHYNACCGGTEGRVPISAEAAHAFDKGVCPVCIPGDDQSEKPRAVSRDRTIMVRFSDAWINQHELSGVFGFMGQDHYSGREAHHLLSRYLHGEAYNTFLQAALENGSAQSRANLPYILPSDGTLVMSRRHIGSDWYIIVRPEVKFAKKWKMYWRVSSYDLQMEGDTLAVEFDRQTVEEHYSLKLESMHDSVPVYNRTTDVLDIEIYEALEGNIAVIREKRAAAGMLENVRLVIGGCDAGIELSGYMDGKDAIYCCMLTDAELEQLRANARAELWHVEQVKNDIFRVNGSDAYDYYSDTTGEKLFTIEKEGGLDPVDDDFRLTFDGDPDCFVAGTVICRYLDSGREIISVQGGTADRMPERVTPLFWYGEGGVFLVESSDHADYAPDDRLFEQEIQYDVRLGSAPEDEWGSYLCWLVDENGEVINHFRNQAFTVHKDGSITFETLEGDSWIWTLPGKLA